MNFHYFNCTLIDTELNVIRRVSLRKNRDRKRCDMVPPARKTVPAEEAAWLQPAMNQQRTAGGRSIK
jgi:hypothetical protein